MKYCMATLLIIVSMCIFTFAHAVEISQTNRGKSAVEGMVKSGKEYSDFIDKAEKDPELAYTIGISCLQPDTIETQYEEGVTWLKKSASLNYKRAQCKLAQLYYDYEPKRNLEEALRWGKEAIKGGYDPCYLVVGLIYNDLGLETKNQEHFKDAMRWFREDNSAFAKLHIGLLYANGNGVNKDVKEGLKWIKRAAESGVVEAQRLMANQYYSGKNISKDYKESLKWYKLAASKGDVESQCQLAIMYRMGYGSPVDHVMAYMWANLAAASGNQRAREILSLLTKEMTPTQIEKGQEFSRRKQEEIDKASTN